MLKYWAIDLSESSPAVGLVSLTEEGKVLSFPKGLGGEGAEVTDEKVDTVAVYMETFDTTVADQTFFDVYADAFEAINGYKVGEKASGYGEE